MVPSAERGCLSGVAGEADARAGVSQLLPQSRDMSQFLSREMNG